MSDSSKFSKTLLTNIEAGLTYLTALSIYQLMNAAMEGYAGVFADKPRYRIYFQLLNVVLVFSLLLLFTAMAS